MIPISEHRLVTWEPSFRKYVSDYEGDGEWSPSYLKREDVIPGRSAPEADSHYECVCGEEFGTDEEAAKTHVKELLEGENQ